MCEKDVLKAQPFWIENRCYRLLPIRDSGGMYTDEVYEPSHRTYTHEDEPEDPDLNIMHQGNRFYTTIHVPVSLMGHVKGKNSRMLKVLQQNGAIVKVPPSRSTDPTITILGATRDVVECAYKSIKNIACNARLRESFTHFVSFPINSERIQSAFLNFKEDILRKHKGVRGISESIFQKPSKLHLTVVTLVLLDEKDKQNAEAILARCRENILKDFDDKQFIVHVKGVEYMNDDPSEVDVLYAKLQELNDDTSLQVIADTIMQEFVNEKLANEQYEKVKLHITLMNTLFRDHDYKEDNSQGRITFDARPLLQDYNDYEFGEFTITDVHISVRYSESSDGYYMAICKMKLN